MKKQARIIFVGIHKKPGMESLDSRTMTGKVIDRIIEQLKPYECIKSNIFDKEYFPNSKLEIWNSGARWYNKFKPINKDLIILLGKWTQDNFLPAPGIVIKLAHPASFNYRSKARKEEYINIAVEKIKSKLK